MQIVFDSKSKLSVCAHQFIHHERPFQTIISRTKNLRLRFSNLPRDIYIRWKNEDSNADVSGPQDLSSSVVTPPFSQVWKWQELALGNQKKT